MIQNFSVEELLTQVQMCQQENDYQRLLNCVDMLLKKDPNNADFLLFKLQAVEKLGLISEHLALIQKYVDCRSTDATGFILLYQAYIAQGNFASAAISLVYAVSLEPNNDELITTLLDLIAKVDSRYKRIKINVMTIQRIGHLACEIEPLMRKAIADDDDCLYLFISPNGNAANKYLYQLLEQQAFIVEDAFFYQLYLSRPLLLEDFFWAEYPYDLNSVSRGINNLAVSTTGYANLVNIYQHYPAWLTMPLADVEQCWHWLAQYQITPTDKVVCLHVRDAAYLNELAPNIDFSYHDYRDTTIENYRLAVEYLLEQGYKVIRIGTKSNQVLSIASSSYLDLCQHRDAQLGDMIEVMLLAHCQFLLGCSSGPTSVTAMFDTPTLAVNVTPFHPPYSKHCRFIPKRLFQHQKEVKLLDVCKGKALSSNQPQSLLYTFSGKELAEYGYQYMENSEQDILAAVKEFSATIIDRQLSPTLTEAQKIYYHKLPQNFVYKACQSLVCDSFLTNYPELFE